MGEPKLFEDRLAMMDEKQNSGIVGFHMFLLKYPRNKHLPFCIVEGEDEKYYGLRVKMCCDNLQPKFISCGGKTGVKETYSEISKRREYDSSKLFFFVDRDFDDPLDNPRIYETPCYSIENLYTTDEAFSNILRNEFKLDELDADYQVAMDMFIRLRRDFHNATLLLNAWMMCQRELVKSGEMSKLNLNNLKLSDFVRISLTGVEQNYTLEKIEEKFSHSCKIPHELVLKKLEEIRPVNHQRLFRGKFEVRFLRKLLELMHTDICSSSPQVFSKKRKISLNLYNIVSQFSLHATTPDSLVEYIHYVWGKPRAKVPV